MSAYLAAVLADAPFHYWRLADPGGAVIVDIGSSRNNLYRGGGNPQLGYTGPISDGGACFFPGADWFTSAASAAKVPPLSVEGWIWQAGTPTHDSWALSISNFKVGDQATSAFADCTITGTAFPSTTAVTAGFWHYLVFTAATTLVELWLDGVKVVSQAHAVGSQTAADFVGSDGSNGMQGFVSEAAFYNYVLSNAQIAAHYAAADQISLPPAYQIGGYIDPVTGLVTTELALVREILAAVRRTV